MREPQVLHASSRVLVIDKPMGWLSVPSRQGAQDTRPCVGRWLEQTRQERLWPVHRLDVPVSGLLLFARDAQAHRLLNVAFERRTVRKAYEAWSEVLPPEAMPTQVWRSRLRRGKKRTYVCEHGQDALTRAEPLGTITHGGATLGRWRLWPETGRPHQLRVHMRDHGYVICGDALYGATASLGVPALAGSAQGGEGEAIALRAVRLELDAVAGWELMELPALLEAPTLAQHLARASLT